MGVYHLISVAEDQLRNWQGGDHDELLRNVGSAVVIACLDPEKDDVSINAGPVDANGEQAPSRVTVRHIDKHDGDEFSVWVWSSGDSVCIADLPDDDLDLIIRLAYAVQLKKAQETN